MNEPIFFYPHLYLRDRQLDTIRNWEGVVLNPKMGDSNRKIVTEKLSLGRKLPMSWVSMLPLPNIKLRPAGIDRKTLLYVWGGIPLTGRFILELDSPFALTGYNLRALQFYKSFLLNVLSSERCVQIRCISKACRSTLIYYFGKSILHKTTVVYPKLLDPLNNKTFLTKINSPVRFLYISTQFEIKGGRALIDAFQRASQDNNNIRLDVITFLPDEYRDQVDKCKYIEVHSANLMRGKLLKDFVSCSDVLIHPTYADTFGMVVLEAMGYGLAVIATDVYAIKEMVLDGQNGYLLQPPISNWDGYLPSKYYYDLRNFKKNVIEKNDSDFSDALSSAILKVASNRKLLESMKNQSRKFFKKYFSV